MKEGDKIFYNYLLRVEFSSGRFDFQLLTETGRVAADGVFTLPSEFANIDRMLPASAQAVAPPSALSAVREVGQALYRAVFTPPVQRELLRIIDVGGVVSLAVATRSRRVAALPWEALNNGTEPLMKNGQVIICRSAEGFMETPPEPIGETPRVMLMSLLPPEEQNVLLVQKRSTVVWNVLKRFEEDGIIDAAIVGVKNVSEMQKTLNTYLPHILCFISISAGGGVLLSTTEMVTASKIAGLIQSSPELRCVLLTTPPCEQMTNFDIAWQLVHQGIPSVLARRIVLEEKLEGLYLNSFFETAFRGGRVDAAHFAGSSALISKHSVAYVAPVLFISSPQPIVPKMTDEELSRQKEASLLKKSASSTGIDRARLLLSLAHHHFSQRRFSDAIEVLNDAAKVFEEAEDVEGLRRVVALSAACHAEKGDLVSASSLLSELLGKYPDKTDSLQIFIFDRLGFVLLRSGDLHGALNAFREALRLNTKVKRMEYLAVTSLGLGETFLALGSIDQAAATLRRGIGVAEQLGSTDLTRRMKSLLATILVQKGSFAEAASLFSETLSADGDDEEEKEEKMVCRLGAAISALLSNDEDTARTHFTELFELLKERPIPELQLATLFNLVAFSMKTVAYDEAVYYILQCRELAVKMGRGEVVEQLKNIEERIKAKVGSEIYALYLSGATERLQSERQTES